MALKDDEAVRIAAEAALRKFDVRDEMLDYAARALDIKPGDTLKHVMIEAEDLRDECPWFFSAQVQHDDRSVAERGRAEAARRGWTAAPGSATDSTVTHVQKAGREEAIRRGWIKP